ncbi:MAG: prepilin-type N-terminal cleavage/methylation domain-containing protein, partial [Plesiomonas shigelloides]
MVTRGFTLLEMMLVIVLLGTVTSMIVPTLSSG